MCLLRRLCIVFSIFFYNINIIIYLYLIIKLFHNIFYIFFIFIIFYSGPWKTMFLASLFIYNALLFVTHHVQLQKEAASSMAEKLMWTSPLFPRWRKLCKRLLCLICSNLINITSSGSTVIIMPQIDSAGLWDGG